MSINYEVHIITFTQLFLAHVILKIHLLLDVIQELKIEVLKVLKAFTHIVVVEIVNFHVVILFSILIDHTTVGEIYTVVDEVSSKIGTVMVDLALAVL